MCLGLFISSKKKRKDLTRGLAVKEAIHSSDYLAGKSSHQID